jgi:hypothetical protein
MMVLMPFLHLSFGHHGEAEGQTSVCCTHAPPEEHAPQDNGHDPDNCSICNLLLLMSQPVQVYPAITFCPLIIRTVPYLEHEYEAPTIKIGSARDPPSIQIV